MTVFTAREKLVIRFLMAAALVGIIVGAIRYRLFQNQFTDVPEFEIGTLPKDSLVSTAATPMESGEPPAENITVQSLGIININTASKEELTALPKIGPVTAERIIRYREDYGPFRAMDDLLKIKGIGPKTLERIRPFVTL
jgi:comEA protein